MLFISLYGIIRVLAGFVLVIEVCNLFDVAYRDIIQFCITAFKRIYIYYIYICISNIHTYGQNCWRASMERIKHFLFHK